MTEAEWSLSTKPGRMLSFIRDKGSERKLRLFACGAVRRIWHLLTDERLRQAIVVSERHADGQVSDRELGAAISDAHRARRKGDHAWRAAYDAARYRVGTASHNAHSAILYVPSAAGTAAHQLAEADLCRAELDVRLSSMTRMHFIEMVNDEVVRSHSWTDAERIEEAAATEAVAKQAARTVPKAAQTVELTALASLLRDIFGSLFRPLPTIPIAVLTWNDGTPRKLAQVIYEEGAFDRLPLLADALEDTGCTDAAILTHCRSGDEHVRGCWVVDLLLGKD
jgi:hypothetical protein